MFITGLVVPVPERNMEAYRRWLQRDSSVFRSCGCIKVVDLGDEPASVNADIGSEFSRAINALEDERIVFSWQVWPDKESFEDAETQLLKNTAITNLEEVPFDPRRISFGFFKPAAEYLPARNGTQG